ncbi:MAG: hypothetical protein IT435_11105 [Phycisphaerales bacterium]|nr:hypothetical protein [Phycisphaerales bacterium]
MSLLQTLLPSLFHRRLLVLLAGAGLAVSILGIQVGRLGLTSADQALAAAEAKLIRRQMTPTVRGRILDRKGRILAQDRPSYDIAIAYENLAEGWAAARARYFVPRADRELWTDLSAAQRQELLDRATRAYQAHVDRGWDLLAKTAGITTAGLAKARQEAIDAVARMHDSVYTRTRAAKIKEFKDRNGKDPTPQELLAIEQKARIPLKGSRVIIPRISDTLAFQFQTIIDEQIDFEPFGDNPRARADRIPLIPGLAVFDAGDRDYPLDSMMVDVDASTLPGPLRANRNEPVFTEGIASHVIGWMRQVWTEDEQARQNLLDKDQKFADRVLLSLPDGTTKDRGEYLDGDRVGQVGIEGSFEQTLRGMRGLRTRSLDSDRIEEIPAEPGHDIKLTIDYMLQARIQAAMTPSLGLARVEDWHRSAVEVPNPTMPTGTPINGAAVVIDVNTGEILAMVSTPPAPHRLRTEDPESIFADPLTLPYLNRAINRPYPPGSIAKPLILVEAVKRNAYQLDQHIECTGHLLPNQPNMLQCWIWKRHKVTHTSQLEHDLDAAEAIMVSCNIFFFTLGRRLGPDQIAETYRDFNVDRGWDLGIGPEVHGLIGKGGKPDTLEIGDAIQMGIGQGPIAWTPLHAAAAYATLARGGVVIPPTIVQNDPRRRTPDSQTDLGLSPAAIATALEGLRRSANEELGSGHAISFDRNGIRVAEPTFNAPGIRIIGKTGTATAPDLKLRKTTAGDAIDEVGRDDESDGVNASTRNRPQDFEVVRSGDHSWFVVLAGNEGDTPRYAIAVVMEYAGSGARVSGPICNQIVHALIKEGYLQHIPAGAPAPDPDEGRE